MTGRLSWPLATGLLALTVSGCVGAPGRVAAKRPPGHVLRVGLIEWAIVVQARTLAPGPATLLVTNAGTTAHDLRVSGSGGTVQTPLLEPGQADRLDLQVRAGERLALSCTVPGHQAQGMYTHLVVS